MKMSLKLPLEELRRSWNLRSRLMLLPGFFEPCWEIKIKSIPTDVKTAPIYGLSAPVLRQFSTQPTQTLPKTSASLALDDSSVDDAGASAALYILGDGGIFRVSKERALLIRCQVRHWKLTYSDAIPIEKGGSRWFSAILSL